MPVIKPTKTSAPVFYPKTDYTVVKYLDLVKYVSLIQRNALFFCRVDKLEDQFEGTTANPNFNKRVEWYKYLRDVKSYFNKPMSDADIINSVKELENHEKQLKSINCVNCWNKKEVESMALWKIYSDLGKGIMIESSINRLVNALENVQEEIKLSEVKYINYQKDLMPDGNSMFPYLHKQKAYEYENEVRLIHEVDQVGWLHDWSKEEVEDGVYIKIDLNKLIEKITLAPNSPPWFFTLIQDITNKYGINKTINKSELSLL